MSDEARVNIIRGFTGDDDDDRLCIKIVSLDTTENAFMTYQDVFYIITDHERYFRCNDLWYPHTTGGIGRMIEDIKRDLGLSTAQAIMLDQAIADLMIAGG